MMYLFGHGLSLLINHGASIWLRNLPGFFWFPMANRWLHFISNSVCPYDVPVWPWHITAYKSRDVHLVAQFTWFLMVSYGLLELANHETFRCIQGLYSFQWLIGDYKPREANLVARFTWFLLVSYGLPVHTLHRNSFGLMI